MTRDEIENKSLNELLDIINNKYLYFMILRFSNVWISSFLVNSTKQRGC